MDHRPDPRNPYCRPASDPLRAGASARQRRPAAQLLGAALTVVVLVALALWMYVVRDQTMAPRMMTAGPLVGGGALIVWTLVVHRFVCGDRLALAGLLLALHYTLSPVLSRLFPPQPPPPEIVELLGGVSRSPALLALWLGPVVWIGVAGFEELWRVHLLRRLWLVLPGRADRWAVIFVSATLVAGVHLYQPPAIMVSIGLLSLVQGAYFLATGRFWSMVVAHALYDSFQVVLIVHALRAGGMGLG